MADRKIDHYFHRERAGHYSAVAISEVDVVVVILHKLSAAKSTTQLKMH
jgi:hypothetical protein